MRTDAEKDGVARLASRMMTELQPIGKIHPKGKNDELPQLFNILKGKCLYRAKTGETGLSDSTRRICRSLPRTKVKSRIGRICPGIWQVQYDSLMIN